MLPEPPPPHSSLMSMCAAPVRTLAGVLGLSSRPAQCSKCSGDRFCPGGSRVSPRVPKVPADTTTLGGVKGGEGVRVEADQEELKATSSVPAGAHLSSRSCEGPRPHTAAPRVVMETSELVSMEQKMGLARPGAGLSLSGPTCLPLTEDCPRLPPPSPHQMPVPPLSQLRLAKLRGSSEESPPHTHTPPVTKALRLLDNEPSSSLSPGPVTGLSAMDRFENSDRLVTIPLAPLCEGLSRGITPSWRMS